MSQIRKKSLKVTTWIYFGFLIGALNTYFFTHKAWFATDENGLTRALLEIGLMIYAFSSFGTTSFINKFFPYYHDNLENKENDLLGLSFIISLIGFLFTFFGLYLLDDVIIRKFSTNSFLLVKYFYWVFPLGFFILQYYTLEAYANCFHKSVITAFLKETAIRAFTLTIISLRILGYIDFGQFITLFSLQYLLAWIILLIYPAKENLLHIHFKPSRVTKKFRKKILTMLVLTSVVIMVNVLRQSMDGLILAAKQNLTKVGIFGLASFMVSVLQAPFRSIVAVTVPLLSRAWKSKDFDEISRIYQRSSINLLTFSLFFFFLIWLNFSNAIVYFNINPVYLEGKWVFFILGIVTTIELGTGVNGQIISTSNYWRFEMWTSLLLTAMIIPLSFYLTNTYGIYGPAFANLISFSVYNSIRYFFLLKKFQMQPFTTKTLEIIVIACISYAIPYLFFQEKQGITVIILSSVTYAFIFGALGISRKITPDLMPILFALKNRISNNKN